MTTCCRTRAPARSSRPDRDREVPRRDEADNAERLARDLDIDPRPYRRHFFPGEAQRLAGKNLKMFPARACFADPFGQRLAFLAGEEPPELVLAREDLVAGAIEDVRAFWMLPLAHAGNACLPLRIAVRACAASLRVFADDVSPKSDGIPVERRGRAATHSPAMKLRKDWWPSSSFNC
jgi:hypothetical protein